MVAPTVRTTGDLNPDAESENDLLEIQFLTLQSVRRPLTPAPAEGPVKHGVQSEPTGDLTESTGQLVGIMGEQGRGAPPLPPSPAPSGPSLIMTPATYLNPNHYDFPPNLGGRGEQAPLAHIPRGEQLAYELRQDWRRPAPITNEPVTLV